MGAVPAVAVLKTSKPVAGDEMGPAAFVAVNATRGGKKPLELLFTSNCAEALGVVVPIPTCAKIKVGIDRMTNAMSRNLSMGLVLIKLRK